MYQSVSRPDTSLSPGDVALYRSLDAGRRHTPHGLSATAKRNALTASSATDGAEPTTILTECPHANMSFPSTTSYGTHSPVTEEPNREGSRWRGVGIGIR